MNPTLWMGNHIMVDKLSVDFGTINVGDIVVFKAPPDVKADCNDDVTDLVKRVIGTFPAITSRPRATPST